MDDLVRQEDRVMMGTVNNEILTSAAWSSVPLGHDTWQMRSVIQHENPTKDSQYRQVIRELWSRWEAYQGCLYEIGKTEARMVELDGWIRLWRRVEWVWPIRRIARGRRMAAEAERRLKEDVLLRLQFDLKHRILREARGFLALLHGLDYTPAVENHEQAEADNWNRRAALKTPAKEKA